MSEVSSRLKYPNPFNPSGLEFELPGEARVTLQIYDEEGRELTVLLEDALLAAGKHTIEFYDARGDVRWDGKSSEGHRTYFYRLSIEIGGKRHIDTKRIVLA